MGEASRTERRKKEKERDHSRELPRSRLGTTKEDNNKDLQETSLGSLASKRRERDRTSSASSSASSILTTSSTSTVKPSKAQRLSSSSSSSSTSKATPAQTGSPKSPPGRSASSAVPALTGASEPVPARDVAMPDSPPTHTLTSTSTSTTTTTSTSIARSNTVPSSFESRRSKRASPGARPSNISPRPVLTDTNSLQVKGQYPARKGVYRDTRSRDWDSESNGDEELTPRPRRFSQHTEFDPRQFDLSRRQPDQLYYPPPPPGYGGPLPPPPLPHHNQQGFPYDPFFNGSGSQPIPQGQDPFPLIPGPFSFPNFASGPSRPRRRRSRSRDSVASDTSDVFAFLEPSSTMAQDPSTLPVNFRNPSDSSKPHRIVVKKRNSTATTRTNSSDEASTLVETSSESASPLSNGFPDGPRFSPSGKPIRIMSNMSTASTRVSSFSSTTSATGMRRSSRSSRPADSYRRFSGLTRVHLDSLERELRDLEKQIAKLDDELLDDEFADDDDLDMLKTKRKELIAWAGARLMIYHQAIAAYKGLPDHPDTPEADFVSIKPEPKPLGWTRKGIRLFLKGIIMSIWVFILETFQSLDTKQRFYSLSALGLIVALHLRARFFLMCILFVTAAVWMNTSHRNRVQAEEKEAAKNPVKTDANGEKVLEVDEESPEAVVRHEPKKKKEISPSENLNLESFGIPSKIEIDLPIAGMVGSFISVGA